MLKKWKLWTVLLLIFILLLNTANIARLFYPVKYMDYIRESAEAYRVDPYLVMSVIKSESNFKQDAVSHKNASGLMQIMEPTAKWLAQRMGMQNFDYAHITDPRLNIQMGCYYIAYLLDLYEGNEQNAIAAYNAGEGTVNGWLANPAYSADGETLAAIPYPETRTYVTRVERHKKMYQLLYKVRTADLA